MVFYSLCKDIIVFRYNNFTILQVSNRLRLFGQFLNKFFYQVYLHIAMNLSGRNPGRLLLKLNVIIFIGSKSDFSLTDNDLAIQDLNWFLLIETN